METAMFDPKKPTQTKEGRAVRILCSDAAGTFPIVAIVLSNASKGEILMRARGDGTPYSAQHGNEERLLDAYHLVNVKVKKWKWVWRRGNNVIISGPCSEEDAKGYDPIGRIQESLVEE